MNILVVDDEPSYRMLLEHFLKDQGWTVCTASNGEEGLKKLRETKIDFIISDVYMPIMDGIKFQKAIHAIPEFAQIPFLFVSAFDDDYTMEAVRSSKYIGFMKKAKPVEELKEWIDYLTSPIDKRRIIPPGAEQKVVRNVRHERSDDKYRW